MAPEEPPAPPPAPTPEPAPTPPPTPPEAAPALLAELAELRAWKAQQDAQAARKLEEERLAQQNKLVEKGAAAELAKQHEAELQAERRKTAELAARNAATWKRSELALALASQPLVPGASAQLAALWDGEFEVSEKGDRIEVRARDGQTAAAWVAAQLKKPEFSHFVPAKRGGGGTGAQGGQQAAPTLLPDGSTPAIVPSTVHKGGRVITEAHLAALAAATPAASGLYHAGLGLPQHRGKVEPQ